jgi:PBP1b-binding outer membrane lipoprotein LpoB
MRGIVLVTALACVMSGCVHEQATSSSANASAEVLPSQSSSVGSTASSTVSSTVSSTTSSSPKPTTNSTHTNTSSATSSPISTSSQATNTTPSTMPTSTSYAKEADAKKAIEQRAKETIKVLKEHDMAKLAELIHPKKGVQFSPYSYIHTASDVQVMGSGLAALWANTSTTHWGEYDGSGDPIDLTFPDYWDKFVYNQDFAAAPQISYNMILGKGNMINNVFSIYPTSTYITVEYHFPGLDPQYQGMDWTSLRLIFENAGGQWVLVAVVHDQHTM